MNNSTWHIKDLDLLEVKKVADEFSLPTSIASIMSLRGITSREISSNFFYPNKNNLHDPFLLKDMEKAVERIIKQKNKQKKILILGDYDVDGISSTAMLYLFFKKINIHVSYYIPHRDIDGYGVSIRGIDFAHSIGADLIITCDCGINAFNQLLYAKGKGIDVIVTDHHKPESSIPDCAAVINPNRKDCSYPFKDLCGAGVAFKLALSLTEKLSLDPEIAWSYSDLVTLGTAADIVPIIDENRIIVSFGLELIRKGNNIGLKSLIETSSIQLNSIEVGQIIFWVIPKINAAGRMGDASRAVQLLTTDNLLNAIDTANLLNKENEKRKIITQNMENESISMVENKINIKNQKSIILYKEGWHAGIIGIIASRIKEIYHKPTIIIAFKNKEGKGSCRSIPSFDIVDGLVYCKNDLDGFGGHPMAAGLTINKSNIASFIDSFEEFCSANISDMDLIPMLYIDIEINISDINNRLINFLKHLEPYGPKNPNPKFISKNLAIEGIPKVIGKDRTTIKFNVRQKKVIIEAIAFRMIDEYEKLISGRSLDIVYNISKNNWNGKTSLQLEIKGIKYSNG